MNRKQTIAAPAAPASTSARPAPSRRPTSSTRGAAFPTSPSSTRARSPRELRPAHRQSDLWLRRLPGGLPLEQVRLASAGRRSSRPAPTSRRRRSQRLAGLDDAAFRRMFAGSPIKRIGRARFLRNVMIAIGNSRRPALTKAAMARLDDLSPLVRGAAIWALSRLLTHEEFAALESARASSRYDPTTADEWASGLGLG